MAKVSNGGIEVDLTKKDNFIFSQDINGRGMGDVQLWRDGREIAHFTAANVVTIWGNGLLTSTWLVVRPKDCYYPDRVVINNPEDLENNSG